MNEAVLSSAIGLLLVAVWVYDLFFGEDVKNRGLLQAVGWFLLVAFYVTFPSCSVGHEDREGPDIPYSF